jgi:putative hemin transport protein
MGSSESRKSTYKNKKCSCTIGVSEAELLVTSIGEGVTVLNPDFPGILTEAEQLGKVMALTRNDECVHERKGTYLNGDFSSPHAQLFVGEDIDLRIFLNHWKFAFAVVEGDKKAFSSLEKTVWLFIRST